MVRCPPQDRMQERPVGPGLVASLLTSTPARFMLLVNSVPHCGRRRAGGSVRGERRRGRGENVRGRRQTVAKNRGLGQLAGNTVAFAMQQAGHMIGAAKHRKAAQASTDVPAVPLACWRCPALQRGATRCSGSPRQSHALPAAGC